jgi:molybdopterin converting factor small subunit
MNDFRIYVETEISVEVEATSEELAKLAEGEVVESLEEKLQDKIYGFQLEAEHFINFGEVTEVDGEECAAGGGYAFPYLRL